MALSYKVVGKPPGQLSRDLKPQKHLRQEGVLEEQQGGQHGWSRVSWEMWQDRQGSELGRTRGRVFIFILNEMGASIEASEQKCGVV